MQEAAKDVVSQEVISGEVSKFMAKSGSMQQEELVSAGGSDSPAAERPHSPVRNCSGR